MALLQHKVLPINQIARHHKQRRAPFFSSKQRAPRPQQRCASTRRESIAGVALAPFAQYVVSVPLCGAEEVATASARQYRDQADLFSLTIPAGWEFAEGQIEGNRSFQGSSGARRTLAWYPAGSPADQINVTLTITNTSVEFTGLGRYDHGHACPTSTATRPIKPLHM